MKKQSIDAELVKCFAVDGGWELLEKQPDPAYMRFVRNGVYLDIWRTGTIRLRNITDPYYINTFYRDNSMERIKEIFSIPEE